MNITGIIVTVLLAGFIGWFIAWITIKILFYPIKPIRIFGFSIQGIFPGNQQLIAKRSGQIVNKEFLSFDQLEAKVINPENLEKLRPDIEGHIDHFLRNKLKDVFPMLSMLMGEKTILQLKEAFLLELESLFPVIMKSYMNKLRQDLNLEKMVEEKIGEISAEKLANMVYELAKKEIKYFKIIGGLFGLTIGLLQVLLVHLLQ